MADVSFAEALKELMSDERLTRSTIEGAGITERTGYETICVVMKDGSGRTDVVGPVTGDGWSVRERDAITLDRKKRERKLYDGHFHPAPERIGVPSQKDFDSTDLDSWKYTPIYTVCTNDDECVNVNAYRRKKPASGFEFTMAFIRQIVSGPIEYLFGHDVGLTGVNHRRFLTYYKQCLREAEQGNRDYLDVVPEAMWRTGVYESANVRIPR